MEETKLAVEIVVAIVSSIVAFVTLIITSLYRFLELREVRRSEKRKEISIRLNEFYGPLLYYLNLYKALSGLFRSDKPKDFRTLTYLLDPDQEYDNEGKRGKVTLSEADKKLLEEIIETEKNVEDLIITKSGFINSEKLTFSYKPDPKVTDVNIMDNSLISATLAHFRLLRMAYFKELSGDVGKYKEYVYPREFDIEKKKQVQKLNDELRMLY